MKENWGNTIIIRHSEYLYSSLSHLKPGSITVKKGERVRAGDFIGKCGNSGRSPFPHLHFQMQSSPFIGSPTISYRISNYIKHQDKKYELISYGIPSENDLISNVETNNLLRTAFRFIPGRDIIWEPSDGSGGKVTWEVQTSAYNYQYIKCLRSGAVAWFKFDDSMFWFTHYTGSKKTLLYQFFLATYKVPLGYYNGLQISDKLPVNSVFGGPLLWLQDFAAPFILFLRPEFRLVVPGSAGALEPQEIKLESSVVKSRSGKRSSNKSFEITVDDGGVSKFRVDDGKDVKEFKRCV